MLVSLQWLNDYIDISDLTAEEAAEKLTRGGIEVDHIHRYHNGLEQLVVGEVLEVSQHPEADKLSVCQVDTGDGTSQIVCGAPNVAEGQKVAVALPGAELPNGMVIKEAKLRGQPSQGMICSLNELGISDSVIPKEEADGITVLPQEAEVGTDAAELLQLNDAVLELDLTPNRADGLSMIGLAYEMAALLEREMKLPEIDHGTKRGNAADEVSVQIDVPEDAPYYGAKVCHNVTLQSSPLWLKTRLMAAGIRPINNVVDITNFVLLEYGQPLHAFDFDAFASNEVLVRRALDGETIETLDGTTRTLQPEHLVITNGDKPHAVAGVMGGAESEVTDATATILLEAAQFNSSSVRRASKDLGLRSESSLRFEKGIDTSRTPEAAERAARLFESLAGADVLYGTVEADYRPGTEQTITTTAAKINNRLGTALSTDEITAIFERLDLQVQKDKDHLTVYVPPRRADLAIEEDLSEEVARIYGYDQIPSTLPEGTTTVGRLSQYQARRRSVRRFLEMSGIHEAVTYSLTRDDAKDEFRLPAHAEQYPVHVAMPMSADRSVMRTSLIPHLLEALSYNRNRQMEDTALFEMGSVFLSDEPVVEKQPNEREMIALTVSGTWQSHRWRGEKQPVDFFTIKGVIEGMLTELGLFEAAAFVPNTAMEGFHPGRTAEIEVHGEKLGVIGEIHPSMQKAYDLAPVYAAQLDIEKLLQLDADPVKYTALPRFPAVTRDLAVVVSSSVAAGEVARIIEESGQPLLESVALFDVYEGEHIEEGKKSLAFSLRYRDPEKTLTDDEVSHVHENIVQNLERKAGAALRS
ncbi:phenylalanyl-tRNA synthetase beta subunit [Salsuginibacillus halophilus]|uniref:Phenylalanine--tRNA ligase beta subunit n=1 Tax=Salsuginibacillus halophilus TaxID=517424 RepID=A0A2P8HCZ8_9BACI|nr:phenylalanine--tRNA ligase subunit beta [Salsuginibacillus halophilus]PSL44042.1 phenylalanyl-tRNA synthetase beta subunit [Salsuginibacillus halophilus]